MIHPGLPRARRLPRPARAGPNHDRRRRLQRGVWGVLRPDSSWHEQLLVRVLAGFGGELQLRALDVLERDGAVMAGYGGGDGEGGG